MIRMRTFVLTAISLLSWAVQATAGQTYELVHQIPIGGEGGWDILTIDSTSHRLYLSHATKVVVVDLEKDTVKGEIADTPGVHAFLAVPELNRGFSSNGRENKSSIVDLTTLKTIAKWIQARVQMQLLSTPKKVRFTFSTIAAIPSLSSMRREMQS